ncbi:4-amino-4-deoxy-L-arabinose transferase [Nocardioides daejeonensis]|uniref:4-amino-4-deoxy-L-arabinose transferase n=1 Tax=Nocardioides daejeonensis TaxID=1046556 RepID=UPI001951F956|nr:4-amino-4-deoxy-L-arabinose transferase [Nocardioides daejeonensis]
MRAGVLTSLADRVADLTARLLARPARLGSTRLLCIDGRAGAGKTRLATAVARRLDAPIVHLDHLYPGWYGLSAALPTVRTTLLEPIAAGRAGGYRRWDWHLSQPAEWCTVPVTSTLVLEGVGACTAPLAQLATFTVWVEASTTRRRERALARDGATFAPHWDAWAAQEEALLAREQIPAQVDLIIDNEEPT